MKRFALFLCLFLTLFSANQAPAESVSAPGAAESVLSDTSTPSDAESGLLRVWLKSLGNVSSLTLRLSGSYTIGGSPDMVFDDGATLTVSAVGNQVRLKCGALTLSLGGTALIARHQSGSSNDGMTIDKSPRATLYRGSLELSASGGQLSAILLIDIEEYLKGVVPYEMSDSFPLEALKAQAVAARSYALRRRADRGTRAYDLVDTPADQVFYGYDASFVRSIEAVEATKGLCGLDNGRYAACFYTASNGGQTALACDVLSADSCDYLAIRDDPYDLENPASPVQTLAFAPDLSDAPDKLVLWLTAAAAERLGAMGYSDELSDIRVTAVTHLELADPKFGAPNRTWQTLRVFYTVDARALEPVYAEPSAEAEAEALDQPIERDVMGYVPGAWACVDQEFECDLTIYDQIKDELGLGLSVPDCEITSLVEDDDLFVIQLRRYGHGVGMSQRGAQVMAGVYGMSCADILAFYYPGLVFETVALSDDTLPPVDLLPASAALADELLPDTLKAGESVAVVTLSTAWSTLNVRDAPSTDARILAELYHGATVIVVSLDGGWARVRTAAIEGFVSAQYLSLIEDPDE